MQPLIHSMDATEIDGITRTKLRKSKRTPAPHDLLGTVFAVEAAPTSDYHL
jgi:hypothetical protein